MDELEVEEVLPLIPEDVIFNIFSRIPLKSLFRLRSVSKQWCKLIDHPCLAPMHMLRREDPIPIILYKHDVTLRLHMLQRHFVTKIRPPGRTMTSSLSSSSSSSSYTLQASHVPFVEYFFDLNRSSLYQPFGSCNGLVYFTEQGSPSRRRSSSSSSSDGGAIIVSNPLRRISLKLPPVHQNFAAATCSSCRKTYGLGFDSSNNSFKMVCVFSTNKTLIQTLGTNTWREISQVPPCPISGTPVYTSRSGFLHWKIDPFFVDYENIESMIVSFDVRKEEFKFTPHPYFHSKDPSLFQLLELNGNLAMVDLTFWEIWVLKDYDRKYWVKECCIPIAAPGLIQVMGLSKDGEVLIKSNGGFFVYGPKTDLHYVQISCPYPDPSIYCFTGSLFSISNLMAENE